MKYSHYFQQKDYVYGNQLMKEGQPFDMLHIIVGGEFELKK